MRAEELDKLTEAEFREKANDCFVRAENISFSELGAESERIRLQLEAQFYLSLVARKHDERVARRDFWMEVAVIALIGAEIILSFVFGWLGISEGKSQATVLGHMDQSTAATATIISGLQKAQNDSLQTLKDSLEAINGLNGNLTKETGLLTEAQESLRAQVDLGKKQSDLIMRQLAILQSEFEMQNKRPILEIRAATYTVTPGRGGKWSAILLQQSSIANVNVPLESNNNGSVDIDIRNVGDAPAVNVNILATPSPGVTLRCIIPSGRRSTLTTVERPTPSGFDECSGPKRRLLPPIEPRPSGRQTAKSSYDNPGFDVDYDENFRIDLNVSEDVINFMLEIVVLGDRLSPAVYEVHGHSPSHGKSLNFNER